MLKLFTRALLPDPGVNSTGFGRKRVNLTELMGVGPLNTRQLTTKKEQLASYTGWVFGAIKIISNDIHYNPWVVKQIKKGVPKNKWKIVTDSPIHDFINDNFEDEDTFEQQNEFLAVQLLLTGESYLNIVRLGQRNRVISTQTVISDWIDDAIIKNGRFWGWKVTVPGYTSNEIPKSDVSQIRYPHPSRKFRGMSPVEAFALSYNLDLYARVYGTALLKNRNIPDLAITSDVELEEDEAEVIRARWEKRYSEPGGVAVLGHGSKIQTLSQGVKDVAFLEIAGLSKEQILALYGVPESKFGLSKNVNRATAVQDDRNYKENTILPILRKLEFMWNRKIFKYLKNNSDYYLEYESPVDEEEAFLYNKSTTSFKVGSLTLNQYLEETGRSPVPYGDVYYIPNGVTVMERPEFIDPTQKPAAKEPQEVAPKEEDKKVLKKLIDTYVEQTSNELYSSLRSWISRSQKSFASGSFENLEDVNDFLINIPEELTRKFLGLDMIFDDEFSIELKANQLSNLITGYLRECSLGIKEENIKRLDEFKGKPLKKICELYLKFIQRSLIKEI